MHTKKFLLQDTSLFSKTEMMITRRESMMQSTPHKLPARTPSTKNKEEKLACCSYRNKYKSTDYKRWLPKGDQAVPVRKTRCFY